MRKFIILLSDIFLNGFLAYLAIITEHSMLRMTLLLLIGANLAISYYMNRDIGKEKKDKKDVG